MDAVGLGHGHERATAAAEAQRQNGHLADLPLILGNVGLGHAEHACGRDLVEILAALEEFQHVEASRPGQPRVDPRLDAGPVGDGEVADQGTAQHALQDLIDRLVEVVVALDQVGPNGVVVSATAGAREVVKLDAVRREAPRGRAAGEDKRASGSVVLGVGQVGHALKLRHAAGRRVVDCLDHSQRRVTE